MEQFLPSPRGTQAWIRAGNAEIEASQNDVVAVTADVVLEAQRLYYGAAVAEAQARALAEAASDAKSLLDVVGRRVELGEAAPATVEEPSSLAVSAVDDDQVAAVVTADVNALAGAAAVSLGDLTAHDLADGLSWSRGGERLAHAAFLAA